MDPETCNKTYVLLSCDELLVSMAGVTTATAAHEPCMAVKTL
jgi:hypothetical protein